MATIRAARHYQKPDAAIRRIALSGRSSLQRHLRSALPHLRDLFDRGKALHLLRGGRVREMRDAVDWHHYRNVLKNVFDYWARIYEAGAALGARKINGSFSQKRRRVRFRKGDFVGFYKEAGHDVSDEPRDEHGQWTSGGGSGESGGGRSVEDAVSRLQASPEVNIGGEPEKGGGGVRVPFPQASDREIENIKERIPGNRSNLPEENISLSHLTAIQPAVGRGKVAGVIRNYSGGSGDDKPLAVRYGGKTYLWDGTHRATAAYYLGRASISMRVLEIGKIGKAIGDRFTFDRFDQATQDRLRGAQDNLIRDLETQARNTIDTVVLNGQRQGLGAADIVDDIWSVIDLTAIQAQAVLNYEGMLRGLDPDALRRQLRADDMDSVVRRAIDNDEPLDEAVISELVDAYEENYLDYRARTIAQTESVRAANWGLHDAYSQAIERGALPDEAVKRFWQLGDHPCPICESIPDANPEGVGVDEDFDSLDGPQDDPPVHPSCMCSVEYVTDLTKVPDEEGEEE